MSNDEPATATRWSTSRVAGRIRANMLACSACAQSGPVAESGLAPDMSTARRASSVTRKGTPRPRVVTSLTSSAGGSVT